MFFVCFWWEERYFLNFCLQIPEIVPTQVQIVFYTLSATIKIYKKNKTKLHNYQNQHPLYFGFWYQMLYSPLLFHNHLIFNCFRIGCEIVQYHITPQEGARRAIRGQLLSLSPFHRHTHAHTPTHSLSHTHTLIFAFYSAQESCPAPGVFSRVILILWIV